MQIIIAAVVLVALVAWIVVKNDEMSGLGRNVKAGSLRHPHGKLVRAKATTAVTDETPLIDRLKRSMPCISSFVLPHAWCCIHAISRYWAIRARSSSPRFPRQASLR